jgi:hypothetical protein
MKPTHKHGQMDRHTNLFTKSDVGTTLAMAGLPSLRVVLRFPLVVAIIT